MKDNYLNHDYPNLAKLGKIMKGNGIKNNALWLITEFKDPLCQFVIKTKKSLYEPETGRSYLYVGEFTKRVPTYSFHQLWKVLPEWVKKLINYKVCNKAEKQTYIINDLNTAIAIDKISDIFTENWDNWLVILAEMIIYLDKKGMMK